MVEICEEFARDEAAGPVKHAPEETTQNGH
jgi:hypothetical protein